MAKVIVRRLDNLDNLKENLYTMIEKIGGLSNYMKEGDTVLIKPNFVVPKTSNEGVTTSLEIISSLCEIALENGASKVYVGDSAAQGCDTEELFQKLGVETVLSKYNVDLIDFNKGKFIKAKLNYNYGLKEIRVPEILTRVDRIWNVPKAKTHYIDKITCALKNYVGFIPLRERLEYHHKGLSHLVASLHKEFKSDLIVVDALVVGEGEGPVLVDSYEYNVILAGDDPVAIDSVVGTLFGYNYRELEFPMNAYNLGVGEIDPNKMEILGEDLQSIKFDIKPSIMGIIGRYKPVNIIMGGACPGCLTWFKNELEGWLLNGTMKKIEKKGIKLTSMLGFNAKDERFEEHLKEGEYFVIGDCSPEKYKNDHRVIFIPGCCPGVKISQVFNNFLKDKKIL